MMTRVMFGLPGVSLVPAPEPAEWRIIGGSSVELVGKCGDQRHSCGCGEFPFAARMDLPSLGQLSHGGHGYRDMSVGRLDPTRADGYWADTDRADAELMQRGTDTDDIGQGVERTDLVEVHILCIDAVDVSFRVGESGEHGERIVVGFGPAVPMRRALFGYCARCGAADRRPGR